MTSVLLFTLKTCGGKNIYRKKKKVSELFSNMMSADETVPSVIIDHTMGESYR